MTRDLRFISKFSISVQSVPMFVSFVTILKSLKKHSGYGQVYNYGGWKMDPKSFDPKLFKLSFLYLILKSLIFISFILHYW